VLIVTWFQTYESESILENIARNLYVTDAPAFLVKYIAEVYQKDFWELWEKISDVSRRRLWICPLEPLSTEGFFDITTDDRIFWWTEEEPLSFSQELQNWFSLLSDKYFEILSSDSPKLSIRIVMELLELSSEKHEFIIAFSTFFEETIDNIGDKRYAALWELYRLLLLESSFQDQCLSLFESSDTRENKPVKMLRRFHALAANRALRKTVFKF